MHKIYSTIDKYGWSDEGKNVKVYITSLDGIGAVDKSKINCKFSKHSFDLTIDGYKGKNLRLCIPKLFKEIIADSSKFNIKSSSVSITLKKVKDGKWTSLKESEKSEGLGGGYPGMGLGGGYPGMGAEGGYPGMGAEGGFPGMGAEGGFPGMGTEGGYPGMGDDAGFPGMGGAEDKDPKDDPNKGLMEMMKKMYEEGDEETKKMMTEAMMKGMADQK